MSSQASRALALFDTYIGMSPGQRRRALADLRREDPGVHDALASLLASDDALHGVAGLQHVLDSPPEALLARHAGDDDHPDPRIGTRKGPWRIERMIGAGGMGTVYEAWRDDGQYRQRVALKCIRLELASERVLEGFRREREILAGLDHPNIATLFDGGVDEDGAPWFAMRYIQGAPIDEWCDQRELPLGARVTLLIRACDALAYAHGRMVLHQDIKPSNLLIAEDGQLQLLDFGLAASLSVAEYVPRIAISEGYTAPEAVSGAPPSTTMDVWSLGMVMYRLLCGSLPAMSRLLHSLDADARPVASMSQLASRVDDDAARHRGLQDAPSLSRRLAGDLDAIASRCVAADPDARYPSVAALREDLERWLHSRPVAARNGGAGYRLSRFVRRHRMAVGLSAVAALALVAGGGFALWHMQRAAEEARSSAALSRIFEETLGTATLTGLGETALSSQSLLEHAEQRIRSLSLRDQPRILAQGLSMLARNHAVIGDYDRALALAEEASGLHGSNAASTTANQATRASLLNLQGRHDEALHVAREALSGQAPAATAHVRLQLMTEAARSHWNLAEQRPAREMLDHALTIARQAGDPAVEAELLILRGGWNSRMFLFSEAEADLQRAIELAAPASPLVANEARRMTINNLLQQERNEEGYAIAERLLDDYRKVLGDTHPLTARTWILLANLQCGRAWFDQCETSLRNGERVILERYGDDHPEHANVLRIQALLASGRDGLREESLSYLRRADAIYSARYPSNHDAVQRIRAQYGRRTLLALDTSSAERKRNLDEVIEVYESILRDSGHVPLIPLFAITLANALSHRGEPGDIKRAHRLLADNREVLARFPANYNARFYNEYMQAQLHLREGDLAEADAILEGLIPPLRDHQDSTNNKFTLGLVHTLRAAVAQDRNDPALARTRLVEARDHFLAAFGPEHMAVRVTNGRIADVAREGRFEPAVE